MGPQPVVTWIKDKQSRLVREGAEARTCCDTQAGDEIVDDGGEESLLK